MNLLIYTRIKSQVVTVPDGLTEIASSVKDCLHNRCTHDYAEDGIVHLLNVETTREALRELSDSYKSQCFSLQRLPASLKALAEGEGLVVVDRDCTDDALLRAAYEALFARSGWKTAFDDARQVLTELKKHYHFYSFGFDGINVNVGEPDKSKRVCRFCGKSGADKFHDVAHAIQDSLGNRLLVCLEECDECNHTLNSIEDNFLVMMDVRRSLYHISRKKSAKSARVVGENFVIEPDADGNAVLYFMQENCPADTSMPFEVRLNHKTNITNENMYKALVKMVIDLLPSSELSHFKSTIKWVTDNNWSPDALPSMWFANNIRRFYRQPVLDLFIKKDDGNDEIPYCTAILWIYDVLYTFVVPFVDVDAGRFKYDNNLIRHWSYMKQLVPGKNWYQQNSFDYTPAQVWVEMPIDLRNPYIKILPKTAPVFEESLKETPAPTEVYFPMLDTSAIYVENVVRAKFQRAFWGVVTYQDLTDITLHITAPTYSLYPLEQKIEFLLSLSAKDTTDTIDYFSVNIIVDFRLDDFWSNLNWQTDKDGMLVSYAFDYHLRDYIFETALKAAESQLAPQRSGTPFAVCNMEKLFDNKRLMDKAELMIPSNDPNRFFKAPLQYHMHK